MLPWVQGRIGILKNHLQLGADLFHLPCAARGQIPAFIIYFPLRRTLQPYKLPADSGFAAAGFSHQPQRFTLHNGKSHTVHGFNKASGMCDDAALNRVILFHVFHFYQGNLFHSVLSHLYLPFPS